MRAPARFCRSVLLASLAARPSSAAEHRHRQFRSGGNRPQRPHSGRARRWKRGHDARPAAPQRVPAGRRDLGLAPHEHRHDPGERELCSSRMHRDDRDPGRRTYPNYGLLRFRGSPRRGNLVRPRRSRTSSPARTSTVRRVDMTAQFNSNLGQTDCFTGFPFYLGLDNLHGSNPNFLTGCPARVRPRARVLLGRESGNGTFRRSLPAIFDRFIYDDTLGQTWDKLTSAQRATSAGQHGQSHVVRHGGEDAFAATYLGKRQRLLVTAPAAAAGTYSVGTASFGPALSNPGVTGQIVAAASGSATDALQRDHVERLRQDRADGPRNLQFHDQGQERPERGRDRRRHRGQQNRGPARNVRHGRHDHDPVRPRHHERRRDSPREPSGRRRIWAPTQRSSPARMRPAGCSSTLRIHTRAARRCPTSTRRRFRTFSWSRTSRTTCRSESTPRFPCSPTSGGSPARAVRRRRTSCPRAPTRPARTAPSTRRT